MYRQRKIWSLAVAIFFPLTVAAAQPPTLSEVIAASKPTDWRALDSENTVYLDLEAGRVVIEMAPAFAPLHVANIKRLAQEHYYDALSIIRVQDNYVVQWGDPDNRHPTPSSAQSVPPEFERPMSRQVPFTPLSDGDVYASQVGFSTGFPVARNPTQGRMWLAHCYGMVGVGRDVAVTSGSGAEIYVVIGHSPRHLDRNVALVGRVIKGLELLSSLPRGSGAMGFYEKPEQHVKIKSLRMQSQVAADEWEHLEVMRTDTPAFAAVVQSRRNRTDAWYAYRADRIELCNVPVPVREVARDAGTAGHVRLSRLVFP